MAIEWLGTIAAGVVGLAGIRATYLTGKQGRQHTEQMALRAYEQQRKLAEDARRQERLGDAYVRLLVMVEHTGAWAQAVKPVVDTDPPAPDPALPSADTQIQAAAAVNAFASDGVRDALKAWRDVVMQVIKKVQLINLEESLRGQEEFRGVDFGRPRLQLEALRPKEAEARSLLTDRVASDLGHRPAKFDVGLVSEQSDRGLTASRSSTGIDAT
jgi:hypothetical protein